MAQSLILCQMTLCVLEQTFKILAVYSSALALTSPLGRTPVSDRGEKSGLSRVFPGHVNSPAYMHGLLGYPEHVRDFQSLL